MTFYSLMIKLVFCVGLYDACTYSCKVFIGSLTCSAPRLFRMSPWMCCRRAIVRGRSRTRVVWKDVWGVICMIMVNTFWLVMWTVVMEVCSIWHWCFICEIWSFARVSNYLHSYEIARKVSCEQFVSYVWSVMLFRSRILFIWALWSAHSFI